MDEAVDQVMGRSSDEKGAEKAVGIRRSQQKERAKLLAEIQSEQKVISKLSEERAPIAAEVRKVEAEVGPIKYIAQFVYGETDPAILEKAVTWIIILIISVFDPLAVMLLIASQVSFQKIREAEGDSPQGLIVDVVSPEPTVTEPTGVIAQSEAVVKEEAKPQEVDLIEMWNKVLAAAETKVKMGLLIISSLKLFFLMATKLRFYGGLGKENSNNDKYTAAPFSLSVVDYLVKPFCFV
jgi:hypothetical protein